MRELHGDFELKVRGDVALEVCLFLREDGGRLRSGG